MNHVVVVRNHPAKPQDSKLWGNSGVQKGVGIHTVKITPGRDNMRLSQWERCPFPAATKHCGLTQQQQLLALQPGSHLASHWFIESAWSCALLEGIFFHIPSKSCSQTEGCRVHGIVLIWTPVYVHSHRAILLGQLFLGYLELCVSLLAMSSSAW